MTRTEPACERRGLLLSLRTDSVATADQIAELDAHVASCEACRRSTRADAAVDAAVGDRLRERAALAVPAGFSAAVVAAVLRERAAAAAQNRFLRWTAAAAVFVTAISIAVSALHEPRAGGSSAASVRDVARDAVFRPSTSEPNERK